MNNIATSNAARHAMQAVFILAMLTLVSCGGGSATDSATPPSATGFADIAPKAGFTWSTTQQTSARIALSRASGQALGNLTLLVSDYVCDGSSPNPIRGSRFTSFVLSPQQQAALSLTLDLHALQLQVPAAAGRVLAEVVDNQRKLALYGRLVVPASLASMTVSVPDTPTLANCANPG